MYFPNREELSFRTVLAFPNASRIGLASRILTSISDPRIQDGRLSILGLHDSNCASEIDPIDEKPVPLETETRRDSPLSSGGALFERRIEGALTMFRRLGRLLRAKEFWVAALPFLCERLAKYRRQCFVVTVLPLPLSPETSRLWLTTTFLFLLRSCLEDLDL